MTPSRSRPDAASLKPEVVVSDTKETMVYSKNVASKRISSKQENMNLNCLSSSRDKSNSSGVTSWSSLPANLMKQGKVCLYSHKYISNYMTQQDIVKC